MIRHWYNFKCDITLCASSECFALVIYTHHKGLTSILIWTTLYPCLSAQNILFNGTKQLKKVVRRIYLEGWTFVSSPIADILLKIQRPEGSFNFEREHGWTWRSAVYADSIQTRFDEFGKGILEILDGRIRRLQQRSLRVQQICLVGPTPTNSSLTGQLTGQKTSYFRLLGMRDVFEQKE